MKPIQSIGIIMDGNRRWAKAKGLPAFEGHRAGFEALKKMQADFPYFHEKYGLEYATLYAFSSENWNRDAKEIEFLMKLFGQGLRDILQGVTKDTDPTKSLRIRIVGQRERLSPALQALVEDVESQTSGNTGGTVAFAISYGGRPEILQAVSSLIEDGVTAPTEEDFSKRLWTAGIPDPDLVIRTSGEYRLSNFLPWQAVYSELFFTQTLWPDFSTAELEGIFEEFQMRDRRKGK